jgi:hypothetical protein
MLYRAKRTVLDDSKQNQEWHRITYQELCRELPMARSIPGIFCHPEVDSLSLAVELVEWEIRRVLEI